MDKNPVSQVKAKEQVSAHESKYRLIQSKYPPSDRKYSSRRNIPNGYTANNLDKYPVPQVKATTPQVNQSKEQVSTSREQVTRSQKQVTTHQPQVTTNKSQLKIKFIQPTPIKKTSPSNN